MELTEEETSLIQQERLRAELEKVKIEEKKISIIVEAKAKLVKFTKLTNELNQKKAEMAKKLLAEAPDLFNLTVSSVNCEIKARYDKEVLWTGIYIELNYRLNFIFNGANKYVRVLEHGAYYRGSYSSHNIGVEYCLEEEQIVGRYGHYWCKIPSTMVKKIKTAIKRVETIKIGEEECKNMWDSILNQVKVLLPHAKSVEYYEYWNTDHNGKRTFKSKFIKAMLALGDAYFTYKINDDKKPIPRLSYTEATELFKERINEMILSPPKKEIVSES